MIQRKKSRRISPKKDKEFNVLLKVLDEDFDNYSSTIREIYSCNIFNHNELKNFKKKTHLHLVIIDVTDKENFSLFESIKRSSLNASFILLTRNPEVSEAVKAIKLGADDYIKMPFSNECFKNALFQSINKELISTKDTSLSKFLLMMNSCRLISSSLNRSNVIRIVKNYIKKELLSEKVAVYTINGLEIVRIEDYMNASEEKSVDKVIEVIKPFKQMIQMSTDYALTEYKSYKVFIFRFNFGSSEDYFCICLNPDIPRNKEEFKQRLEVLKTQIEVTGKNIKEYNGVKRLIFLDDVTGLYNTRYLKKVLDREIKASKNKNSSFAILFIDVDKFKNINDKHGHIVGTKVLNELANHLKLKVRKMDIVFRYGGDEFIVIISPSDRKTAVERAEQIRKSVEKHVFLSKEGLNIKSTVSIGVAVFFSDNMSSEKIISIADKAMYSAKKISRNQVFIKDDDCARSIATKA